MHEDRQPEEHLTNWKVQTPLVACVFLLGIILLVPWQPELFEASLDSSWRFFASEAFVAGSQFGTEVVFTFGPYGFLYWSLYHPTTYALVLLSWILFTLVYLGAVWRIGTRLKLPFSLRFSWLLGALILGAIDRDNTVLNGILILALIHYFYVDNRSSSLFGIVLSGVMGWVGLVKFTFFVLGVIVTSVVAVDQLAYRRRMPWTALVYLGSVASFWLLAGQNLSGFPRFLANSWEISSGYVDAMSISGGSKMELLQFVVIAGFLSLLVAERGWRQWRWHFFLPVIALTGVLYILFKHGFVRHDEHPIIASLGLIFLVLSYGAVLWRTMHKDSHKFAWAGLFVAVLLLATETLTRHTEKGLIESAAQKCVRAIPSQVTACVRALSASSGLPQAHAARSAEIRTAHPLPTIEGSVDLYPFEQNVLMAHGLTYRPRPVFQSYSAYTETLAILNANHLRGPNRPQTILFDVKTIDQRFPALDDGLSWPELLAHYDVAAVTNTFLILTNSPERRTPDLPLLNKVTVQLNERVEVPAVRDAPIWTRIDVQPTFFGRVVALLIKPPPLYLDVTTRDGVEREYRFMPRVAGAGFLLSPVVGDRDAFAALTADGGLHNLDNSAVASIRIRTAGARWNAIKNSCYQPGISISFHELQYSKRPPSPSQ